MTSDRTPSACQEFAGLLQPYVDGELGDEDVPRVAEHVERCAGCRAVAGEQAWVRTVLRQAGPHRAPPHLAAAVRATLADLEDDARSRSSWLDAARRRVGAFLRGGLVMVPAGAVALGIVALARYDLLPGSKAPAAFEVAAQTAPVAPVAPAPAEGPLPEPLPPEVQARLAALEPKVGFPVHAPAAGVELVSARAYAPPAPRPPAPRARLELRVPLPDGGPPVVVEDVQARTGQVPNDAIEVLVGDGRRFHLARGDGGRPTVHFETAGIHHALSLETPLDRGRHVRGLDASVVAQHGAEAALLLHVAERLAHAVERRRGPVRGGRLR